jgi:hypothetical protein
VALNSDESRLVSLLNAERANAGRRTLSVASDLVEVARRHSQEMASRGAIYHGDDTPSRVSGWRRIGEVVGRGPSASDVHRGFMGSSYHRAQLLDAGYTQVGAGVAWGGSGSSRKLYVTEIFVERGAAPRVSRSAPKRPARPRVIARRPSTPPPLPPPPPPPPPPEPTLGFSMLLRLLAMDEGQIARTGIPFWPRPPPG